MNKCLLVTVLIATHLFMGRIHVFSQRVKEVSGTIPKEIGKIDFLAYSPHFRTPAEGSEFVMPVGSGILSAMVSYDSALQIHLSRADWLGLSIISPPSEKSPAGGISAKPTPMSPGHLTLRFLDLPKAAINTFDQFIDFERGSVVMKLGTSEGAITLEVFGDMGRESLVVHVQDGRRKPTASLFTYTNWRDKVKTALSDGFLTAEEVQKTNMSGKEVVEGGKVADGDVLYNRGLGLAAGSSHAKPQENGLAIAPSANGEYDVYITTTVTRDGSPLAVAQQNLKSLLTNNYKTFRAKQLEWWKDFWQQSWIELKGDKDATYLTRLWLTDNYTYAGLFSGTLPPPFTGGTLLVMRDFCSWTGAYTWQNTRELIWPMGAANHLDYATLYFKTYDRFFSSLQETAAKKGKTGIYVPEYVSMKDDPGNGYKYTVATKKLTPFNKTFLEDKSNLTIENGGGSHTSHILQDGGELVHQMFDYVHYSGDDSFLRQVCIPWLWETTLFYLKYIKLGDDGLYHSYPSNAAETWWKVKDPITDLCAMRYCFEQVVKHGKSFGFAPDFIQYVQEKLEKLADFPKGKWRVKTVTNDELSAQRKQSPNIKMTTPTFFQGIDKDSLCFSPAAEIGEYPTKNNFENPELYIVFPYGRVGMGSQAKELEKGINTFNYRLENNTYGWSPDGVQAARLGLPNTPDVILHFALRQQVYPYGGFINAANKLPGTVTVVPKTAARYITDAPQLDAQGVNMTSIQEMTLQSHALAADENPLEGGPVRLLPSIRRSWSGSFKLRARGGFLITCSFENGTPASTYILSEKGNNLKIVNPFPQATLLVNGKNKGHYKQSTIELPTQKGDLIELIK